MESTIKYTSDGKKVAIIGKLNAQETIVQEIFVVAGNEVPSGENFVVKSLHDAPAKSWKQKNLEETEDNIKRKEKELEDLKKKVSDSSDGLKLHLDAMLKTRRNVKPEMFDTLIMFLSGKIKYIVDYKYEPNIFKYEEYNLYNHSYHGHYKEAIRLVSLFGKSDGNLEYRLCEYYDGSGGGFNLIMPFVDYDDAYAFLKDRILRESISDKLIIIAKDNNITLDAEKVEKFYASKKEKIRDNIKKYQQQIFEWENSIALV